MQRPAAALVLIGVLAGAAAGIGAGLVLGGDEGTANPAAPAVTTAAASGTTATTGATTTTTRPVFVAPDEAVIGPVALVPEDIEAADGEVVFRYRMSVIAPFEEVVSIGVEVAPQTGGELDLREIPVVLPTGWTLLTDTGEIPVRPSSPGSRSVSFPVPGGFTLDQVEGLRIDAYRLATPLRVALPIPVGDSSTHVIAPGIGARVNTVLEQGTGWLIVVEMSESEALHPEDLVVEGVGPEWTRATLSLSGTTRWTMEYRGDALPDPIPFEARGVYWAEVGSPVEIDLTALLP